MRIFFITEWQNGKPTMIHEVPIADVREPGFYRQTLSLDAFKQKNANFVADAYKGKKHLSQSRWFSVKDQTEWDLYLRSEERAFAPDNGPVASAPHTKYEVLWDFYQAIGYRKTIPNINYWQTRV